MDFALRFGRPFAAIPCCTCSKDFPRRLDRNGKLVKSYAAFVAYLRAKDPRIRVATLPFGGKNQVRAVRAGVTAGTGCRGESCAGAGCTSALSTRDSCAQPRWCYI